MSDLSQIEYRNLKDEQFNNHFDINGREYGVWIFDSGTFKNTGKRGYVIIVLRVIEYCIYRSLRYDHWTFTGNHDFTNGQKDPTVTFKPRHQK